MTRCCYVIVVCLWRGPRVSWPRTRRMHATTRMWRIHTTTGSISGSRSMVGRGRNSATNWVQWWFDRRCFDPICLQFSKEIKRCIRAGVTRSLHTPRYFYTTSLTTRHSWGYQRAPIQFPLVGLSSEHGVTRICGTWERHELIPWREKRSVGSRYQKWKRLLTHRFSRASPIQPRALIDRRSRLG